MPSESFHAFKEGMHDARSQLRQSIRNTPTTTSTVVRDPRSGSRGRASPH